MISSAIGVAGGWKFHSHAANAVPDASSEQASGNTQTPTQRKSHPITHHAVPDHDAAHWPPFARRATNCARKKRASASTRA